MKLQYALNQVGLENLREVLAYESLSKDTRISFFHTKNKVIRLETFRPSKRSIYNPAQHDIFTLNEIKEGI